MTAPALPVPPAWMADALCAQIGGDEWFPEKGGTTKPAKKICASCDVKAQCLAYAVDNDERFGIWGGLSERERRRLRPARPAGRPAGERRPVDIDHGTDAGWRAHQRLGVDMCRDCRTAHDRPAPSSPPQPADPPPVERPGITRPWTPDELVDAVRFLSDYGMTDEQIAPELGLPVRHVQRIQRLSRRPQRGAA